MSDAVELQTVANVVNNTAASVVKLSNSSDFIVNTTAAGLEEDEKLSPGYALFLLYSLLFMLIGAQTGLYIWRQKHKRSYELVTLVGLWLMPAFISVQLHFWRFLSVWLLYSAVTLFLFSLLRGRTMAATTPRRIYSWFLAMHRVCQYVGVAGYVMVLLEVFGVGDAMRPLMPKGAAIVVVWYGLYFGILGRDSAEVAADRMALVLGSGGRQLATVHNCGICANPLEDYSHLGEKPSGETCVQLSCKHCFHELCIRGWTMVGKKDTCPVCLEKVDLRKLYVDRPWDTKNLTWIQMLDAIRYMVVWNPVIFMVISVVLHILGPHHHPHHHDAHINATVMPM